MNKIEVAVLNEAHVNPTGMMMFLARLTQKGHKIHGMPDLLNLYNESIAKKEYKTAKAVAELPHGTIKRFMPITVAIVGASRRFLAQARTHHVGIDWVSGSLQYSNYSGEADFVVPYEIMKRGDAAIAMYLAKCKQDLQWYEGMINVEGYTNDTAGYGMNQALRNILIVHANHQAWMEFIRARACSRNTEEMAYVATLIWEKLYNETVGGKDLFHYAGPDCVFGSCREGKMTCGQPLGTDNPSFILDNTWPLCRG